MKKIYLFAIVLLTSIVTFAQTPNQFKYQAVLRDGSGNILSNQNVTVDISILRSDLFTSVFNETHTTQTTNQGLINLNIGSIEDMSGVNWNADEYFIQITVNGTIMGTSQLLSVPYAINSKNAENTSADIADILTNGADAENIAINNIKIGQTSTCNSSTEGSQRYNSVTKNMEYCNGSEWIPFNTGTACSPQPTPANAGTDQIHLSVTTSTMLAANTPTEGNGLWYVISGIGGSLTDNTQPNTEFSGNANEVYKLEWRISNDCYSSSDNVTISFAGGNTAILTMVSADYQIIVDEVATMYPELIDTYGTGEFYTGATSYYSNFDLRISKRQGQADFEGLSDEEAMALIDERVGEGIIMLLKEKFPNSVSEVNGNDVFYIVNYAYFGNDYSNGTASKKFQCISAGPNPEFIYIQE